MQKLTPEQALETLMAGNTRYVANRQNPHDYAAERQALVPNQEPFAAVIRCADSRVAPEIIFDHFSNSSRLTVVCIVVTRG